MAVRLPAYGDDEITKRVEATFAQIFETRSPCFRSPRGRLPTRLALAAAVPPWGLCVCHREAHVIDDECGAPEFFMHGAKMVGLPGVGGEAPAAGGGGVILTACSKAVKQMPPKALSISQVTECGTVYSPRRDRRALGRCAGSRGSRFHMDGARFANALVSLGCTPAEMTWKRGVDILSFGATKNGCLMAEAVVVFDEAPCGRPGLPRASGPGRRSRRAA